MKNADLEEKKRFHLEHHSRNLGLLTEAEQEKIDETTLLVAGCGVGSLIAISAARLGFEKFILVDGDKVELSNINRQGYTSRDVGKFKVHALARRLKQINPHATIRKYPIFVDLNNAARFVHKADIIIDSIDPTSAQAEIALHRAAQREHKIIIQPSDIGWGAMVQIFTPDSISYEKMVGLDSEVPVEKVDNVEAFGKFMAHAIKYLPEYAQKIMIEIREGKRTNYPQPVSAAYTLSAMTVMAAKRIAIGEPVKVAPEYVVFDPDTILDPNEK